MRPLSPFEFVLILSTLLEFNPLLQTVKSLKRRSVKDVSPYTFLMIAVIGTLWLIYGFTIRNIPLIIGNIIKLFTSLSVLFIYVKYKN